VKSSPSPVAFQLELTGRTAGALLSSDDLGAHADVLASLGPDPALLGRMTQDFELMAMELRLAFPEPEPGHVLSENGWPRLRRNREDRLTIVR
jgi:hypothetical protein